MPGAGKQTLSEASARLTFIWSGASFETSVIPAKANPTIDNSFAKACGMDSRFRGNDCGLERLRRANDTTTFNCRFASYNQWPRRRIEGEETSTSTARRLGTDGKNF